MKVKLLNRIENIVAKDKIAHDENYFSFYDKVLKSCLLQMCQNVSTSGKQLTLFQIHTHSATFE